MSSKLRLKSGSGVSLRGSRSSRRNVSNQVLYASRNVVAPSFMAIAVTLFPLWRTGRSASSEPALLMPSSVLVTTRASLRRTTPTSPSSG
jgi:hypothetical protein